MGLRSYCRVRSITQWFRDNFAPHRGALFDDVLWRDACAGLPWVSPLDDMRLARLRGLAESFLRGKAITPVDGLSLGDLDRVRLAALCCLPVLEFGDEGLHGWSELIVYPGAFRVRHQHVDDDHVQHEWDDTLTGESWSEGPLILSWTDVRADIEDPDAGLCLPIHEMAHKLDALDGEMDGTPPLPREWQRAWAHDFQRAYEGFLVRVDHGDDTEIDPYAAESPEEFFAVCSEYHFGAPQLLSTAMPEVARHLQQFYGASPMMARA
jgi:MtfA peptidase